MNNKSTQEEISIKELFGLFLKLWNNIVRLFLKTVLFIIKHSIPLLLLVAFGWGMAYFYKDKNPRNKRVFIVSATEYSGELLVNSLMNISEELRQNNLKLKEELSLLDFDFKDLHFQIKPIYNKRSNLNSEEVQYLELLKENKFIDESDKKRIFQWSNTSYEVGMISQKDIDDIMIFEKILAHISKDSYTSQLHKELLEDINNQITSNTHMINALGDYVVSLGKETISDGDLKKNILGGENLGDMLFARLEVQRANNKLIAEKVKLEENYRVLQIGNITDYTEIEKMSNKTLLYPVLLVCAYLLIIFIVYILQAALALKEELKTEDS